MDMFKKGVGRKASLLVFSAFAGAACAQTYANATVGGQIAPGVYGRIQIGSGMPTPPLIYAEPVIIQRPPVAVHRAPIYMHVPPGHAKNWGKHCARYNACAQPVYFVQEPPRPKGRAHPHGHGRGREDWDDHPGRGRGYGHGHRD